MMIEHATIFSVFVLIAERVCATLFARRYEKKATKKIVIVVIALEWLAVVGYTIFMVASSFFSTESKNGTDVSFIFTCKSGFTQPEVSISSHIAATLVFAAFLLILTGVILLNRYKYSVAYINKTKHTLSERFQLHENIRGTRLLLPGVAVQCVMSLGGVAVLVIVDKRFRFIHDQTERIILMYPVYEWINLLIAVCTLLYPIVSTAFSSVLAKAAWDMLNCRKQQKRIIVQENMSAEKKNAYTKQGSFRPIPTPAISGSAQKHFAKLTATWEKTFHKKVGVLSVGNSLSSAMSLKATPTVMFWQWINQLFSAIGNSMKRSDDDPIPASLLFASYCWATDGALAAALDLDSIVNTREYSKNY
uniref:G-protein coupled receptors family 1 profile domain-containing protein n=1 Tax=Plectus sambesii TaxID=2011161 RepID=A0A914WIZ6_9BILA